MTPVCAIAAILASAGPVVTAEGVNDLSRYAVRGRLVCLRGTATYVSHSPPDLIVQDAPGGVRVRGPIPPDVAHNDEVRIIGRIEDRDPAARVIATRIERLGPSKAPPSARCFDLTRDGAVWLDARLVFARGTIRSAHFDRGFVRAKLQSAAGQAEIFLPHPSPGPDLGSWPGSDVKAVGVCTIEYEGRRDAAPLPRIYASGVSAIEFVQTPIPPPAKVAASMVASRANRSARPNMEVEVAGVVTAVWDRRLIFVQDATGGVRVELAKPHDIAVGTRVTATGIPAVEGDVGCLRFGRLMPQPGAGAPIKPADTDAAPVLTGATLIRVEGRVVAIDRTSEYTRLSLFDDGHSYDFFLPPNSAISLDGIEPGARMAAVGVRTGGAVVGAGTGEEVLLRDADDLVLVARAPSWWDGRRWYLLGGIAAMTILAASGFARLHRRIRSVVADAAELEDELYEARRLEVAGRLAGGIAHDFNNLLTVINDCADTLKQILPEPHRARLAEDILDAGEQAATLSGQLLSLGLGQREQLPESFDLEATADLNAIARGVARLLTRMVGTDVHLVLNLASSLPRARIEPRLVARILFNLAVNARDAMPVGGTLTLSTALVSGDAKRVKLMVEDTGEGMTPEVRARAFEPYFSTKQPGRGTGLGLATVRDIVAAHGGRIEIESSPGIGTKFRIELPAGEASAAVSVPTNVRTPYPGEQWADPGSAGSLGRMVVLVVDDDDAVRMVARRFLEIQGAAVHEAAGADEAIQVASAAGPIDILVTDVSMPGMGGDELAAHLRSAHPGLKVVFMSGQGPQEMRDRGSPAAYLRKPFNARDMAVVIEQVRAANDAPGVLQ
jgi:signal transduction histidine kinase/CheY-like chemotaxis protein